MATPRGQIPLDEWFNAIRNHDITKLLHEGHRKFLASLEPQPARVRYKADVNRAQYESGKAPSTFLWCEDSPSDCMWVVPQAELPAHERLTPQMVVRQYVRNKELQAWDAFMYGTGFMRNGRHVPAHKVYKNAK